MPAAPLHPQVEALMRRMAADGPEPSDRAARRAAYAVTSRRYGGEPEPVAEVADVQVPGPAGPIPARAYRPAEALDADAAAVVAWFHGGGWEIGDLEGADTVCRALANGAGAVVLSVGYRLAPEHPFPAAVDDADAVVGWLGEGEGPAVLGTDPERIAVAGDSAGGNVAAVAALHARDAVRAQALVYPVTDASRERPSWGENGDVRVLPADAMRAIWRTYLAGADAADPDAAPLLADLRGAPPALVAVAGHDVLRDEGLAYAEALRAGGGVAEVLVFEDMPHGFVRWGGAVDRAGELIAEAAGFLRRTLSPTA